ncbi:hypothetical protein GBA52_017025 [Prunus armeniaca]|nr:hypothetical protein GBA52_017025 [Prunus armeniaca]
MAEQAKAKPHIDQVFHGEPGSHWSFSDYVPYPSDMQKGLPNGFGCRGSLLNKGQYDLRVHI